MPRDTSPQPTRSLSLAEFIPLMAMMMATVALSIDGMLPAIPEIGTSLAGGDPARAALVITAFMMGMGVGTFFTGPLSDAYGRKPVLLSGSAVFLVAALYCFWAPSLEHMLSGRFVQGLGAAGPRVVALAIIRDLYSGRNMARITSLVMMVFTLVPAIAPSLGAVSIAMGEWRLIYVIFAGFALIGGGWLALRLPEPLPPERRRPFRAGPILSGVHEIFSYKVVRLTVAVQCIVFGMLIGLLTSIQPVYDVTYGRGDRFHLWFGLVAVLAASASFINSALVVRLGMRFLVTLTLVVQIGLSAVMVVLFSLDLPPGLSFGLFVFWQFTLFFQAGMCIGNLNALAMEPLGHLAGLGASAISATFTVVAALIAMPIGWLFDGTARPFAMVVLILCACATMLMLKLRHVPPDAR